MKKIIIFGLFIILLASLVLAREVENPFLHVLKVGESFDLDGHYVKLIRVGSERSVVVEVDGQLETLHILREKDFGCLFVKNSEGIYNSSYPEMSSALLEIYKSRFCDVRMVWRHNGEIIGEEPYDFNDDMCSGYRCLVDKEISPACYSIDQCNDVCGGECIKIKETVFPQNVTPNINLTKKGIGDFLNEVVRGRKQYTLVVGDNAPSTDIISANTIFLKFQEYSNLKANVNVELVSRVRTMDNLILIGSPCDNSLITDVSCNNWPYNPGQALIKISNDDLIVAGTTSEDTRDASKMVANYRSYPEFIGVNKIVVDTANRNVTTSIVIENVTNITLTMACGDGICDEGEICTADCGTEFSCNGCLDGQSNCLPIGYRLNGEFCGINKAFGPQLGEGEFCQNNHECESNVCVNNQCIDKNLLEKILNWFRRLFS